ncbi:MAG: MMPL family transporter, partial [Methylococcales bacterium]|nr:MMPL family transporter [Methylococcales bacterium]
MSNLYQKTILSHPFLTIILLLSIFSFFSFHTQNFKLDASADSLLLEGDKDLEAFREMSSRFKTQDILIITYSVKDSLFTDEVFKHITQLKTELDKMQRIDSVMTLLNIPLLKSADISLADMATNVQNLSKPNIDRKRAKDELMNSPIFKDLIISSDGKTTAILINLANDEKFTQLRQQRDDLSQKFRNKTITPTEQQTLNKLIEEYSIYADKLATLRHQDIENIRHIIQQNPGQAEIHLGGVAMIADDMISYIKSDLIVFGVGVLLFIIATLAIIFRSLQWVILPLMSCFFSAILMIGILGYLDWSVTVISSNVISLMLIITLSMNIHLAVRYRQLCRDFSDLDQQQLVMETVNKMVRPCLYTALTTIIAFMSLVTSGIKPVIDFGWMMTIGLSVTFITSFTLFPAILMLRKKSVVTQTEEKELPLVHVLASITKHHGNKVIATATLLAIITAVGISQLRVENSFIDYFSKDTEIYKGM